MKKTVFLNGKFISQEDAKVSILTPGFLYGWAVFETMRSYKGAIVYLDAHLERIKNSSKLIGIEFPYPPSKLKAIIKEAVRINGFKDIYVRLTLCKKNLGTDILILIKKYTPYPIQKYKIGFSAMVSKFKQSDPMFARIKTTNRLFYELGLQEAKAKGFDEALILNPCGFLCEATRSSIFFAKDNEVFTPALECGCLEGITRRVIFDLARKYKLKIYEGNFTLRDLRQADEAFLTNSLLGVMPLRVIEKDKIGKGVNNFKFARFFGKEYNHLLRGL